MPLGIWSRFQSIIFGGAIGAAASKAIEPTLEPARQRGWSRNRLRVLDPDAAAELVATGAMETGDVSDEVYRSGYNDNRLAALIYLAQKAPSVAETLELWRRNATRPKDEQITEAQVDHALAKAGIEAQYWKALKELFSERLAPNIIATAIQRGVMKAPFDLPYNPDVPEGNIKPFPVSPLNAADEAIASGIDTERLRVETALVGLPMALDRAARAYFRGILTDSDFLRAVLEGNARGEWADAELEVARQILTAHDYVEARLRAWFTTDQEMYDGTAKHGMTEADTDLLFKISGRPIAPHRVFIGIRRGGVYDGPTDQIDPAFLKAQQESNQRPEWYNLDWAARFTKPGVFFIRQWLKDGHDPAKAQTWLWEEGWEQTDIDDFIAAYSAAPATPKPKKLTNATIRAAYRKGEIKTREEALTRLEANGLSPGDAAIYLDA